MHHMDAKKAYGEKSLRQLHKNATSCIEQVLEETSHKQPLYGHLTPITKTIQIKQTRHAGHCWRSKGKFTSDVLLRTPSHGRVKVGGPGRTYLRQLCAYTESSLEDQPGAVNDIRIWGPLFQEKGSLFLLSVVNLLCGRKPRKRAQEILF